jgi:hypothetical protein
MQPHTRVQVRGSDGLVYSGVVCAAAQGLVQVRWDGGGATAWVPVAHVVAAAPPPPPPQQAQQAQPAKPAQPAQPQIARAPAAGWQVHGTVSVPIVPQMAAPRAAPRAAPPRASTAQVGGLPRGLVYEPTGSGQGNGQAFFLFFGFLSMSDADLAMRSTDLERIGDDVAAMRAAGYRVVVDLHGDLAALDAALRAAHHDAPGLAAAGVYWSGHGNEDGSIEAHDGTRISPEQISPEAAQRASPRLFVMSACYAGGHADRWKKALGPQANVIGWGAPISNARAMSFLVHDDQSSKGFDVLLARTLGVTRVADDGPLVEVLELSRKHEDRVALLSLSFDELVKAAHERLKCPMDRAKTGEAYFTVRTPPSKEAPQRARAQVVRSAAVGAGGAWIHISSLVGPYTDALDLPAAMRIVATAVHVRVGLSKITPPGKEFVVVETLFRRRRLDPMTFANNLSMVGAYADRLEDLFFGTDQR